MSNVKDQLWCRFAVVDRWLELHCSRDKDSAINLESMSNRIPFEDPAAVKAFIDGSRPRLREIGYKDCNLPLVEMLKPLEREILKHRLEVPECIAEALDGCVGPLMVVESAVEWLLWFIDQNGGLPARVKAPELHAVLIDCLESSTYLDTISYGNLSAAQVRRRGAAFESLEAKIESVCVSGDHG